MTYADDYSLRDVDNINANNIADAVDGLVQSVDSSSYTGPSGSALTMSSTSQTSISALETSVTVADGQSVEIMVTLNFSVLTSGDMLGLQIAKDGSGIGQEYVFYQNGAGRTTGWDNTMTLLYIDSPAAGTYTYGVLWRNKQDARAIYSWQGKLTTKLFQRI